MFVNCIHSKEKYFLYENTILIVSSSSKPVSVTMTDTKQEISDPADGKNVQDLTQFVSKLGVFFDKDKQSQSKAPSFIAKLHCPISIALLGIALPCMHCIHYIAMHQLALHSCIALYCQLTLGLNCRIPGASAVSHRADD